MRKSVFIFVATVILLGYTAGARAGVDFRGEASLMSFWGYDISVDYIVTQTPPSFESTAFSFGVGNAALYSMSSYFYFYQLENFIDSNIDLFSISLPGEAVLTAGFITGVDLDAAPFSHSVPFETESMTASIVNPDGCYDNVGGMMYSLNWWFDPEMAYDTESTVLFITSTDGPVFRYASAQNGDSFIGNVPAPDVPAVPEPGAMLLFLSGIIVYLKSRR
ncbi:MAG: hypothetical protein AB1454_12285 [Candidatus Auribacterota bacterium]